MVRRALALMVAVAVVGAVVGMVGVLGPRPVEAQPTATRSFSADTVAPGGQLMVTVEVGGYGAFGGLTEMLPEGFTYVSSSPSTTPEADGRLIFVLSGEMEVTYTVAAPFTPSMYTFTGTVTKVSLSEQVPDEDEPVIGDTVVTVELDPSPEPTPSFSATRSFNPASVAPGDPVEVTIMARGYGSFGQVVETLPAEFSYVSSSLGEDAEESGLVATFTLLEDPKTFTYTVTAPSTSGRHTFRGIVENSDFDSQPVGGDEVVTVEQPSFSATRSFNPASVAPGDPVEVTIMARGYGSFGQVVETLPAGFSYVSSSLGEDAEESGLVATFTLLEDPKTFTYTVTAPSTSGRYTFRGIVDNSDFERKTFDSRITVGTPPTTPTPRPIRTSRGGGGVGVGGGAATPRPTSAPTVAPTPTPAPTVAPTPTPAPTVAPTAMPAPTVAPTAMPAPTVAPTAMPAPTVAPTAMPAPMVAPTPTAAPPLVPTAAPPATLSPAVVEPTAPVAPPAAPEDEGGLPTWAIVLMIIVAVVLAVGGGLFAFVRGRR